jgi:hypothetical protein
MPHPPKTRAQNLKLSYDFLNPRPTAPHSARPSRPIIPKNRAGFSPFSIAKQVHF